QSALPALPGPSCPPVAPAAAGFLVARALFPSGLHAAPRAQLAHSAKSAGPLHALICRRQPNVVAVWAQPLRRPVGGHCCSAHLESDPAGSLSPALHRDWWRTLDRRFALGQRTRALSVSSDCTVQGIPRQVLFGLAATLRR